MSVYNKPFRYNKKARAYVVTVQKPTKSQVGIYEVTLEHGDRARPHGCVEKPQHLQIYSTYLFHPAFAGSRSHANVVGASSTLQEAIEDVRKAWERVALTRG